MDVFCAYFISLWQSFIALWIHFSSRFPEAKEIGGSPSYTWSAKDEILNRKISRYVSFIFCLPVWKLSKMFFLSCFHKIWNIKEKTTRSMTNICYLFYFSEELQQLTDTRSKQSWDQSLTATTKAELYTTHQMKSLPRLETRLNRRRRWRETASRSSRLIMMPTSRWRWIR